MDKLYLTERGSASVGLVAGDIESVAMPLLVGELLGGGNMSQ